MPTVTDAVGIDALRAEVHAGLGGRPKRLPEKLFYDDIGARIFEDITRLDEYYPTRCELEILEERLPAVARHVGSRARVVEFGSGEGRKTAMLLESLVRPAACIPIDISEEQLMRSCERLRLSHPAMDVIPLVTDFTRPFQLPAPARGDPAKPVLFFFPGSTVGNFEPDQAQRFLRHVGMVGGRGSKLLLGVDLPKSPDVLRLAYDDLDGVTARFNLNALVHLNRVLGTDFDVRAFRHRAVWNALRSRIEMQLVSVASQTVTLPGDLCGGESVEVEIRPGEPIVTEHSYKYSIEGFDALCRGAGWRTLESWTDRRGWFSVHFLERGGHS